jgi:short-subunit dehydrogenase
MSDKPAVLITGASSGIGAVYADRFARRGHDLVLAARDAARLEALAQRLRAEFGVAVTVAPTDLTRNDDLQALEARLAEDGRIGILINNAGASLWGSFLEQSPEQVGELIQLNVVALARLANVAAKAFVGRGGGEIVNIGSVVGLAPEFGMPVYGGTKAFVLHLSQALNAQLAASHVYVQAVLPAATRTEIWERSGVDVDTLPAVMAVEELVDAALVGFDRREPVTIPPLPDDAQWTAFEQARLAMLPNYRQKHAAQRYRAAA